MAIRIIQLGSDRHPNEGLRIGTVRRQPRRIPKAEYASKNIYDVWFPNLSPSEELLKRFHPDAPETEWQDFKQQFLAEMNAPTSKKDLDLLAALSHQTDFSLGCYCEDESRYHRSILRMLLEQRGADLAE